MNKSKYYSQTELERYIQIMQRKERDVWSETFTPLDKVPEIRICNRNYLGQRVVLEVWRLDNKGWLRVK